jgi:hypothetical protein
VGLFRRRELTDAEIREIAEAAHLPPGTVVKRTVEVDSFVLTAGKDGVVHDHCWFCGGDVEFAFQSEQPSEAAILAIEPIGGGEPEHGVCHRACVERARGSIATSV